MKSTSSKKIFELLGVGLLLLTWVIVGMYKDNNARINEDDGTKEKSPVFASPKEVWIEVSENGDELIENLGATTKLVGISWGITLIFGVLIGVVFGLFDQIKKTLQSSIEFIRAIPPVLVFPMFLLSFNQSYESYVSTILFGTLPIMIVTVANGFNKVSDNALKLLRINQVKGKTFYLAYAMEVLPSIFLGARLTFSFALIIAVVTEMVVRPRSQLGIGVLAYDSEMNLETAMFYACLITLGLAGYLINIILQLIEKSIK